MPRLDLRRRFHLEMSDAQVGIAVGVPWLFPQLNPLQLLMMPASCPLVLPAVSSTVTW
jgi:hypothetical protein